MKRHSDLGRYRTEQKDISTPEAAAFQSWEACLNQFDRTQKIELQIP
jgi:hypothetical protein